MDTKKPTSESGAPPRRLPFILGSPCLLNTVPGALSSHRERGRDHFLILDGEVTLQRRKSEDAP